MTTAVKLTSLQNEVIRAYTRWMLSQQVTTPSDEWMNLVSGPVIETPGEDHIHVGYLETLGEWVKTDGGIPVQTIGAEEDTRKYSEYGRGFMVREKERQRGMVQQVEDRIRQLQVTYGRMWALQMLDTLKRAAAGTSDKGTLCLDGSVLIADSHTSPTGDNKVAKVIASTSAGMTTAEAEVVVWELFEALMAYTDDKSRPKNETADNFVIWCAPAMRRPLEYALKAQLILEGGETRTNLLAASSGGKMFTIVSTNYLSTWGKTQLAMAIADQKTFIRARDPMSLRVDQEDLGIDKAAFKFAGREERLVFGGEWTSIIHATLST